MKKQALCNIRFLLKPGLSRMRDGPGLCIPTLYPTLLKKNSPKPTLIIGVRGGDFEEKNP